MSERTLFIRQRPIAQPEAKLPAMLKSPMSESAQAPTAGGSPHSATTPGRCVAMNATWKPQTKNPAVSSRKLGSFHASRTACFIDFSGAAPCAAAGCLPRSTKASGTIASERRPSAEEVDERSEEHTSELQSHSDLVCRLLLEKQKNDGLSALAV